MSLCHLDLPHGLAPPQKLGFSVGGFNFSPPHTPRTPSCASDRSRHAEDQQRDAEDGDRGGTARAVSPHDTPRSPQEGTPWGIGCGLPFGAFGETQPEDREPHTPSGRSGDSTPGSPGNDPVFVGGLPLAPFRGPDLGLDSIGSPTVDSLGPKAAGSYPLIPSLEQGIKGVWAHFRTPGAGPQCQVAFGVSESPVASLPGFPRSSCSVGPAWLPSDLEPGTPEPRPGDSNDFENYDPPKQR